MFKRRFLALVISILLNTIAYAQQYNIEYNGGTIHVESYGEGIPLLIVNGGPGVHSKGFRGLAKKLGEKYRAIIYDQRGTGQSLIPEVSSATITLDKMADDIEVIRKYLKIDKWVVLGHSFGGMMTSYYASKYPEVISGIIYSASGGINTDIFSNINISRQLSKEASDSVFVLGNKIAGGDTSYTTKLKRAMYLAPAYLYDTSHIETVAHRLTQVDRAITTLVFEDIRKMKFDCTKALKKFRKPVLILHGKQDCVDLSIPKYTHKVFRNSKLVLIDECGHMCWLEQPEKYFQEIHEFLAKF